MKIVIYGLAIFLTIKTGAQTHSLQKIWETESIIPVPESILPDFKKNLLYVSLINGSPWDADGVGGVGKINTDGTNFDSTWIIGLSAPKGLGRYDNRIYAADISDVVVIDVKKGEIEKKIPVKDATGLNDITVDSKGIVYVSDSKQGKIWRIEKDVPSLYLDNIKGANGLKAMNEYLVFAEGKFLKKVNVQKKVTQIAEVPESIDGIEPVGNGDFIATSWIGYIFYVTADGQVETLLDSHTEKMNTADLGFDQSKRILYVPTFNAKKIIAYRLK
ncbi:MAG: ATP-binding protein [Ginsengibacter sp.]